VVESPTERGVKNDSRVEETTQVKRVAANLDLLVDLPQDAVKADEDSCHDFQTQSLRLLVTVIGGNWGLLDPSRAASSG
jgi:hypothetical protein